MKGILSDKGIVIFVDDEDYDRLSRYAWVTFKIGNIYYAKTLINGKVTLMHRFIMDTPPGVIVKHKDNDGLNNQKCNLRNCTYQESDCDLLTIGQVYG